jgi:hypothetical protein
MDNKADRFVTCHWLTPTRSMPHPHCFMASARPWSCLRDGYPRPLGMTELRRCSSCPRWERRTFDDARRDQLFEIWGVGDAVADHATFDEVSRGLAMEAWGVSVDSRTPRD